MKVGLIGAGPTARDMARGWGEPVLCSDSDSSRAVALAAELGGRAAGNVEVAQEADLVVLCHTPAEFEQVAEEIKPHAKAVASVLGRISGSMLQARYAPAPTFRILPKVHEGVVLYAPAGQVDDGLERSVLARFARLGAVVKVPDAQMVAAAAVLSVGPAYQRLWGEAQVDAAVQHGLAPTLASRLVAETMSGTAELLATRDYDTLAVRHEVTSPGGSTARGLDALERGGVRAAFRAAIDRVSGEPSR